MAAVGSVAAIGGRRSSVVGRRSSVVGRRWALLDPPAERTCQDIAAGRREQRHAQAELIGQPAAAQRRDRERQRAEHTVDAHQPAAAGLIF
jgi:hypothetical protein